MVEERDGHVKQLQARIAWLSRGVEEIGKAIVAMKDRINNRLRYMTASEIVREFSEERACSSTPVHRARRDGACGCSRS